MSDIKMRCPSCGSNTLIVDPQGNIVCSLLGCKEPSLTHFVYDLQRQLDDAHDKLRRIAEHPYQDLSNVPPNLEMEICRELNHRIGITEGLQIAKRIASGPLGQDWRKLCAEAKILLTGGSCKHAHISICPAPSDSICSDCPNYNLLKSYDEASK